MLGQRVIIVTPEPAKEPEKAGIVLPAAVPAGVVMPFAKVPWFLRGLPSEIVVARPPITFPELAIWNEQGRPAGWHFGMPLPLAFGGGQRAAA